MWEWYRESARCIVHLADVHSGGAAATDWTEFGKSEWFRRGWTLQELLAPRFTTFCNASWQRIGDLSANTRFRTHPKLLENVAEVTRIGEGFLQRYSTTNKGACVAKKIAWASNRETTRGEDQAYPLLGLLHVNMPLLYGEREDRAFLRLQQELIRQSDDDSIFAWTDDDESPTFPGTPTVSLGLLADWPRLFERSHQVEAIPPIPPDYQQREPYSLTNKGILLDTPAYEILEPKSGFGKLYLVELNCWSSSDGEARARCEIVLEERPEGVTVRRMADTLHPDVTAKEEPVRKRFFVRLSGELWE